jgi:methylase of polypeptide subunit release factors
VQQRPAHIVDHCGKLEWLLTDTHERAIDIAEESLGEAGPFVLVPSRGILEIGLGERPND